jgi:hypothetical protein
MFPLSKPHKKRKKTAVQKVGEKPKHKAHTAREITMSEEIKVNRSRAHLFPIDPSITPAFVHIYQILLPT